MTLVARIELPDGLRGIALIEDDMAIVLDGTPTLSNLLHADEPAKAAIELAQGERYPVDSVKLLTPVESQDVWAAGVTYKRSAVARMEESEAAADHYDKVYAADRPELFFKSTAARVVNPGEPVRVRADSGWSVPEPELTLVLSPTGRLVGYTIGNDMSARDIEGENPLYLPQAKTYKQSCAVGPVVKLTDAPLDAANTVIELVITRSGQEAFRGETTVSEIHRTFDDLIAYLFRDNDFPHGAMLLTGTGIIPPDQFTLEDGDEIAISITGIGTLENPVVKDGPVKDGPVKDGPVKDKA